MMKRWLSILMIVLVVCFAIGCKGSNGNSSKNGSDSPKNQQQAIDKSAVSSEIRDILADIPQEFDEVEQTTIYKTWGEGSFPPESAIYFAVGVKDNNISKVKFYIVHFSSNMNWVFWDKLIFANDGEKWEKDLFTFAGQSGDGKSTQVVMGGKYEMWQGPVNDISTGLQLLAGDGKNPILRLQGERKFDYKLDNEDLETITMALRLQSLIEQINYKLVD